MLGPVEAVEDVGQVPFVKAWAMVAHGQRAILE